MGHLPQSISEKLRLIEKIVTAPVYFLIGYASGHLLYTSTVEGVIDLWALNLETGEKIRLTQGGVHGVAKPRPQSSYVVYTRDESRGRELQRVYVTELKSRESFTFEALEPRRIVGLAFDGSEIALTAAGEGVELWLLNLSGTGERLYSTNCLMYVTDFRDGLVVGQGVLKGNPKSYEIFTFDIDAREFRVITPKEGSVNKGPVTQRKEVLFASNAPGREKLLLFKYSSGELSEAMFKHADLEKYEPTEFIDYGWTDDGNLWAIGKKRGRSKLFLDGREVALPEGLLTRATFTDSKVYVSYTSLKTPGRILEVDSMGRYRVLLGEELPSDVASCIGDSYVADVVSFDGLRIPTFIVESKNSPKPGPTIVYVHGGPWSEVADRWDLFIASLAACGYHVVAPNFRGSTGYGEEFRALDIGDPGGGDLKDVVKAAEWAREQGVASKVAIMGYSYGGFMTFLATVKEPDAFDAGVAGAGITDWEEMYVLSDAFYRTFIDILFADKRGLMGDRSAIHFVDRLKVPLCIIHPQNDSRTPLSPVLKYIWKLMERGKTFEVHIVPDAGHMIVRLEDALKLVMPAVIFLEKYLAKGATLSAT
ncbi:MAG: alpha/beta fold hydrolase [Thermofilaceae archaeon]